MSQFSRVKKNSDLYKEIIEDNSSEIIENSLRDYKNRMSKNEVKEEDYVASRLKRNEKINEEINVESESVEKVIDKTEILSDRDLLSDFIEEVKHYNINKGLRSVQDTQTNILNNLEEGSKVKNDSNAVLELTSEIKQIINDLENMEVEEDVVDTYEVPIIKTLDDKADEELISIFEEIETSPINIEDIKHDEDTVDEVDLIDLMELEIIEEPIVSVVEDDHVNDFKSNELLELTQTLNLKLDLQEQELETIEPESSIIDKVLTAIIIFLVVALVLIIAYGIWWVYMKRGL